MGCTACLQEKRRDEAPGLPADVAGSSLRFANHCYPSGSSIPGVAMTCVAGRAVAGGEQQSWRLAAGSC